MNSRKISTIDKCKFNENLIVGIQHEINTFSFSKSNYICLKIQDSQPPLLKQQEVLEQTKGTTLPISGFIENSIKNKETKH